MKSLLLILIFFFIWEIATDDSKINQLREIVADSVLWKPSFDQFKEFIVTGPRPYTLLLFFTSNNSSWCQACPIIKDELEKVSEIYSSISEAEERDLFFVYIEFESHKSYYTYKEQIYTIPSLIFLQNTTKGKAQFNVQEKDRFVFQQDFSSDAITKWINNKFGGSKIKIPEVSMTNIYLVAALAGFIFVSFIYSNRHKKALWTVLALLFPWFAYTGTYFNLSHLPPFIYKQGASSVLIWPSQQMQTISEGLLVASLILFMGVIFAFSFTYVPELRYSLRRLVFYPLLLIMGGLFYLYIFVIWKIKSPWYIDEIKRLSFMNSESFLTQIQSFLKK